jgi:hypothetical protein
MSFLILALILVLTRDGGKNTGYIKEPKIPPQKITISQNEKNKIIKLEKAGF